MTIHDNEPYVHFGWKDPLLSVYSNTNNDGEDKKNSQINKSKRKFNKLTLYPKFSYHFEPRKRYTFIRPLQWFLHNIVKTIKFNTPSFPVIIPHRRRVIRRTFLSLSDSRARQEEFYN